MSIDTFKIVNEAISFGLVPIPLSGKIPKLLKWTDRTLEDGKRSFEKGDNVGIITGEKSSVSVLDFDNADEGMEQQRKWEKKYGKIMTPTVRTGSGGLHLYFKYTPGLKSASKVVTIKGKRKGIDIKTNGGQVVYPGSIHPITGKLYEWELSPYDVEFQEIPDWFLRKLTKKKEKLSKASDHNVDEEISVPLITEERRIELSKEKIQMIWDIFQVQLSRLANVYVMGKAEGTLIHLKRIKSAKCPVCERKHDNDNAYIGISGIKERVKFYCYRDTSKPIWLVTLFPNRNEICKKLSDGHKGPAEIVLETYKDKLETMNIETDIRLYNEHNKLWEIIPHGKLATLIPDIIQPIYNKKIKKIAKIIKIYIKVGKEKSSECIELQKIISRLRIAKSNTSLLGFCKSVATWVIQKLYIPNFKGMFDNLSNILPIKEGRVVDLLTGEVRERKKEDRFSYEIPIEYHKGKKNETLFRFFSEIMLEDTLSEEKRVKVKFLQRLLGYAFTGTCQEQIMVVFCGDEGSNGKSTLCNLIKECMEPLVIPAHKSIIMKRQNYSAATPELHMLQPARLALISETSDHEVIDEDIFKRITGGDEVQSRNLNENTKNWRPKFLSVMVTNHIPRCSGDKATLRRILIFKFLTLFVETPTLPHERKIDKSLNMSNDKDIREALLAFIIEGALEYHKQGLNSPQEILDNTELYKKNMDSFEVFIQEEVDPNSQPDDREFFKTLWNRYVERCKEDSLIQMTNNMFGRRLGAKYTKGKSGDRCYLGIRLRR